MTAAVSATKAGRHVQQASHSPTELPVPLQANTTAVVYATKAVNHVEGGWPKEVDYTEAEHVIRYRKKVRPQLSRQHLWGTFTPDGRPTTGVPVSCAGCPRTAALSRTPSH